VGRHDAGLFGGPGQRSQRIGRAVVFWGLLLCASAGLLGLATIAMLGGARVPQTRRAKVDLGHVVPEDPQAGSPRGPNAQPLRVAVAAMLSPKDTRRWYRDLLQLVAERAGRPLVLVQRGSYGEINELLRQGQIDMAFVCSGPYVAGHDEFGLELLAVPMVNGKTVYHAYFLAHRSSPIECFGDLRGRTFAFTDPDSNTGYLVPCYELAQRGETPESFFGDTFFARSHDNAIKAVAEGMADGASVAQLIWDFLHAVDPTHTSQTKILYRSPPYGIPPVVVPPELNGDLKRTLRAILLSLHRDPRATSLLARLRIERFVLGEDAMYESVRKMRQWREAGERAKS